MLWQTIHSQHTFSVGQTIVPQTCINQKKIFVFLNSWKKIWEPYSGLIEIHGILLNQKVLVEKFNIFSRRRTALSMSRPCLVFVRIFQKIVSSVCLLIRILSAFSVLYLSGYCRNINSMDIDRLSLDTEILCLDTDSCPSE